MTGVKRRREHHEASSDPQLFIYDGDCGFCRRWAGWLTRRVHATITFAPYQEVENLARFNLTIDDVQRASYLVERGRTYGGSRGVARALSHARGAWKVIGLVLDLPGVRRVSAIAYQFVVRNRHRLPSPECEINCETS